MTRFQLIRNTLRITVVFILLSVLVFRCTKDGEDSGVPDTRETDKSGMYSLTDGIGGSSSGSGSGSGTGDSTQQVPVSPGQITAAEWNDLSNWDFWLNLGQNEEFNTAKDNWKFYLIKRYSVVVKDVVQQPIADCEISLKNGHGDISWKARTDNEGKAELWLNIYGQDESNPSIEVKYLSRELVLVDPVSISDGVNEISLSVQGRLENVADILFVVDATGSMTDEIEYLKSELLDVIDRVRDLNSNITLRTGSVFYRDEGDEYLTRVSPFTTHTEETVHFIDNQSADGGGDYEEAVHTALNTAITQLDWSDHARARLLFLVLDAPAHHTNGIVSDLNAIIGNTAEKGIKIIPVSASGINKDTEFLFRFFAAATNGTYVFITNDSGIGGEHIEATVGDYEVELLNDLIVRLINQNTK